MHICYLYFAVCMDTLKLLSLLKACIDSKSFRQGKLIHQKILTLGFQNEIALCKNLINFYISCQSFESAKLVFQTIENPFEISLWNGLIAGYTKNFMFIEALELFDKLLNYPYLKPDSYTYPSVLKACSGLGRVGYGKMIHTHVIKSGYLSDVVVTSSIVYMYGKCNIFGSAIQLFDEMSEKDVACWNTVISCYYQSGQYERALELFEKMKEFGFKPNSVTFTTVLSSCARLLDLETGKVIHNELVRKGFESDGFVSSALVDMYGKCGCLDMAKEVFEKIPRKSLVSWNSMIAGYSLIGDSYSCIVIFCRMIEEGIKPSLTTLSSILMACSRSAKLEYGKFIHGFIIRHNIEPDIFIYSSLLDLYFKCGIVGLARIVYDKMPKTNVVAWNVMISGYVSTGCFFEALDIFNDMEHSGVKPDAITFTSILAACSQLAALEQGKEIHKFIAESSFESNEIVMGALLDMYAKCGAVDEALSIFNRLPERDFVSWTSMITAYGSHGQAREALELFGKMQKSNAKPDRVTFLAIISACSHGGLVDEGCYYFNLMITEFGIKPTIEDYSCLIDLLGRSGRLYEAYEILQRTPNIREDFGLLSTLFFACHLHSEMELGEEIARLLIDKDPDDPSTYITLAKMYSSIKKWDKARNVRLQMKELGLIKNPGCSWIEVDRRIQPFFVDDTSHPQAELVYECLSNLACHMEKDELLLY